MGNRLYFPSLRGRFGDWAYYSTLMKLRHVINCVDYAEEIHSSNSLSDLIQRELREGRAQEICEYINNNGDRFFNSLVVAIYDGSPGWHELGITSYSEDISPDDLDDTARHSVGFLSITQDEKIFALDGQHRLTGIRQALDMNPSLVGEEISVIFVAHENTPEGMKRTRKLFTTLNKQAKPVNKSEIIALDESDVMAIATRHLIENHRFFNDGQIDVMRKQANLPKTDYKHLTTIINLYEVLCIVFPYIKERLTRKKIQDLKLYRPNDEKLREYIKFSEQFFEDLADLFPKLAEYFLLEERDAMLRTVRTDNGGHILFRPIGILIFTGVLKELRATLSYTEAMAMLKKLPINLDEEPYVGTLWNVNRKTINTKYSALCRDILLYMLRRGKNPDNLQTRYARALEEVKSPVELPPYLI